MSVARPPAPPGALRPWRPAVADPGHRGSPPEARPVDGGALVMEATLDPPEAQALFRALERTGLAPRVRAPEPRFAGLAWYGRLARVRGVSARVTVDGCTSSPARVPVAEGAIREPRPEAVVMDLLIVRPPAPGREGAPEETRTVAADLAFAGAPGPWAGAARALVTADSDLTPETLAGLLPPRSSAPRAPRTAGRPSARASTRRRSAPHASRSPPRTRPAGTPSPRRSPASCSGCSPPTGRSTSPCAADGSPSPSAPPRPDGPLPPAPAPGRRQAREGVPPARLRSLVPPSVPSEEIRP